MTWFRIVCSTFHVPFVKRYVDDLILALSEGKVGSTLEMFNTYNRHIQFTVEYEKNNQIPFLDMLVTRTENNILKTSWYRKPYCSNRFINYHSYHPTKSKINLILGMKNRAVKLTHPDFRTEALRKLSCILVDNSYPRNLINKYLFHTKYKIEEVIIDPLSQPIRLNTLQTQNNNITQDDTSLVLSKPKFLILPFLDNLTYKLNNIFKTTDIRMAQKQIKTIQSIYTKTKTPIKKLEQKNVIYKINCKECNMCYIGQTSRSLKGRITSHKSDCKRGILNCALAEHSIKHDHKIDWDGSEILDKASSYYKRTFLEMVHIQLSDHTLNKKSDTQGLSTIYSYVLKLQKNKFKLNNSIVEISQ